MVLARNHTIADKLENGLNGFFNFIPELAAALVILVIGYFVAKLVGRLVARLLQRAGLDRTLTSGQGGQWIQKLTSSPSRLIGRIAFWALFLGVLSLAVSVLGIDALTSFMGEVFAYLPNVIAAVLIFLVAGALAAAVGGLIARTMGDTTTGKIVATVAPILIMAIAGFMILDQLQIAEDVVRITYAALMGAVALGLALAFGLGGREVAAQMLQSAYQRGQEQREQVRRDLAQGRERAGERLSQVRETMEGTTGGTPSSQPGSTRIG